MSHIWNQMAAALVVFATAPGPVAPATLPQTVRAPMHAGNTLTVDVIDGSVGARATRSDQAVVSASGVVESGRSDVRVYSERHGDDLKVCVVPASMTSCSGHSDSNDRPQRVKVDVSVPAGVKLDVHSVDGSVDVEGVSADVKVATVNGDVKIGSSAVSSANTVDGDMRVNVDRLSAPLKLSTVSGTIALTLPKSADAALHASTVSGSVIGAGGVTFSKSDAFVGADARAKLGNGTNAVRLTTVSGEITVTGA